MKMTLQRVPPDMHRGIRAAMENPYRFERNDRFAMIQILGAVKRNLPADTVYINAARRALAARGIVTMTGPDPVSRAA